MLVKIAVIVAMCAMKTAICVLTFRKYPSVPFPRGSCPTTKDFREVCLQFRVKNYFVDFINLYEVQI